MSTPLPRDVAAALVGAALIHLLPLPGLAGAAALQGLYGLPALDPASELLLRHRALMFGLLGGALLLALRWPTWRQPLIALTLLSDIGFLVLAVAADPLNMPLQRVALFDLVAIILLLWAVWRSRALAA